MKGIRVEGFRFRIWPILFAALVAIAVIALSQITYAVVDHFLRLPDNPQMPWIEIGYQHTLQLAYTLVFIAIFKLFLRRDYGLHRPEGKSYVGAALAWGILFGLLMTMVDYGPNLLAHKPPDDQPYPLTALNIAGWLGFEGIYVGPTEEPLFRSLILTYLMAALPGRIAFGRTDMSMAGVVAAVLFALAHLGGFIVHPFLVALGQQFYAVALGILYAYWFEKSRSIVAPIVGHNAGDFVEYVLIFAMVAAFSGPR